MNDSVIHPDVSQWKNEALKSLEHTIGLKSGDGGGTFDPMEARVSKLESQFEKLNDKVDELRIDVAILKEKVSNLPSKGFIVTATVSALAFFSALILFKDTILKMAIQSAS